MPISHAGDYALRVAGPEQHSSLSRVESLIESWWVQEEKDAQPQYRMSSNPLHDLRRPNFETELYAGVLDRSQLREEI